MSVYDFSYKLGAPFWEVYVGPPVSGHPPNVWWLAEISAQVRLSQCSAPVKGLHIVR